MKIKKLSNTATIPTYATPGSAGMDLYSDEECVGIPAHLTKKIHTGIAIAVPEGCVGYIFARSGLAVKQGLRPANCVGVIDSDYRGELIVALHNDSEEMRQINRGERIAQLIIQQYVSPDIIIVDNLDETERGAGGFGSTGK